MEAQIQKIKDKISTIAEKYKKLSENKT